MFNIIDSIDSTNNYAMAQVHAGLAKHGMAWFAREQTAGKGQQGKSWESLAGQNIALSIALTPGSVFFSKPFFFNAAIANACRKFLTPFAGPEITIKWPNDLYWRDRKAGGILIENIYRGNTWNWAVAGIGININQEEFDPGISNPVSLKQVTGKEHDPVLLARELYEVIMKDLEGITPEKLPGIIKHYNGHLYKKGEKVQLKKENAVFETMIQGVDEYGHLHTSDTIDRQFNFGEVSFLIRNL